MHDFNSYYRGYVRPKKVVTDQDHGKEPYHDLNNPPLLSLVTAYRTSLLIFT